MIIIDEDNWREHIGEAGTLDPTNPNSGGERRLFGCKPRISQPGSLKFAAPPTFALIPRNEMASRSKDLVAAGADLRSISTRAGIKSKDQGQTNYCHANSPALAIEILRAVQGESPVVLSPGSIGGPVTGYRNEGAVIEDDLRQIVEFGAATVDFVPANQISKSGWKPGAMENAALHKVTHWWDLGAKDSGMFNRCATLVLQGIPVCVGYNWWGHAVTLVGLVDLGGGKLGFVFRNSWGSSYGDDGYGILAEGKGTPDSAYAPRQATASIN